ncbi:gly-X carboxypeptidase [Cryptococcus neoformans var. grubii H99]|uniref:Gly-X carboxypeptidase n=1 Tax=Cryptococcus neoformans (strain H99 / ATCC 208821 / CBS 10515 / FGSC 9487) TaxID=235443 RepID=J9VDT7_CRYN9|nr:gly-X carboxypeptidase [Cryptococcus neoformans var. grubii H99]AFR92442.1 gly-X carboxypeptidase [Cryptococcus neoformans var. grubii H99]AUB21874.1 gly-X carboxypeptidase [Cryptococcus neoformans var. grubii]|eukprot:XP_012046644.1 gly-X carboxypeptidase [Cryptococcus neoformans var. grubii H99]
MSTHEKVCLPTISLDRPSPPRPNGPRLKILLPFFGILAFLLYQNSSTVLSKLHPCSHGSLHNISDSDKCPVQPNPLNVGEDWNPLTDQAYGELAARRLSRAVQIPTESFDNLPKDGSDPSFDKHYAFADFIESEYPKLYQTLKHEIVNSHAHLFTWEGSDKSLKPILLMAHTDTVPVLPETLDQWSYPPFEGSITHNATPDTPGTWVWGRGASDCKNSLLGIYGAVERLLIEGFKPERTIIISNGYDEEIGGLRGSGAIARILEDRYGTEGISFLVDEGFTGVSQDYGALVASLGMAEKGSVNVRVKVETLGGHSSVPPVHTGIGIMSLILAELEKNPFEPTLVPSTPYFKYLSCMSEHAPEVPKSIKNQIKNPRKWKKLAHDLASSDRTLNSFLATTQAIDLISGGVKVNALPEYVEATINHRIAFTSSINETLKHISQLIVPLAQSLNFTISAFEPSPKKASNFHITLDAPSGFESAPITPSDSKSFELMAGTCKHVFGKDTIVSPSGMFANTDTKQMWNVTRNIYRFTPALLSENVNQHTVDERISLNAHLNTTRFFYKLLRNAEGWHAE